MNLNEVFFSPALVYWEKEKKGYTVEAVISVFGCNAEKGRSKAEGGVLVLKRDVAKLMVALQYWKGIKQSRGWGSSAEKG